MIAERTTVIAIVASSIFTMGRRPYIGAARILLKRRREALRSQVALATRRWGAGDRRVLRPRQRGRRAPLPPSSTAAGPSRPGPAAPSPADFLEGRASC